MEQHSGLFGLRLSNSLHFGHLVGNIRPAIQNQNERVIIVVLADLFTYTSDRRKDITVENVLSMTAEAMSLGLNSDNVKYVIQSKVFNSLSPLFTILSCLLKLTTLKTTQPLKRMLENDTHIQFGELTFPIIQCAEMVSTNSEILYSNIDNLGIVTLTKRLYRKLQSYTNTTLPIPHLCHGEFKNVIGINHRKMSQNRNNAIFIGDTFEMIKKKITSIDTSKSNDGVDLQLLFDYFKIIGYAEKDILEIKTDFDNNKTTPQKVKCLLSSKINDFFQPIREQKQIYLSNKKSLIERINTDTKIIETTVEKNISCIMQNFYNNDFFNIFKQ
jgi:tryptophanyl-tRNA synthetase